MQGDAGVSIPLHFPSTHAADFSRVSDETGLYAAMKSNAFVKPERRFFLTPGQQHDLVAALCPGLVERMAQNSACESFLLKCRISHNILDQPRSEEHTSELQS